MNVKQLETHLERQRERLRSLLVMLGRVEGTYEKLEILNSLPEVDAYFSFPSPIKTFLSGVTPECEYAIKATFAIGQGPVFLSGKALKRENVSALFWRIF